MFASIQQNPSMFPPPPPPPPPHSSDHHHHLPPLKCCRVSPNHSMSVLFAILLPLTILFFLTHPTTTTTPIIQPDPTCPHGRVYTYTLPPSLNQDLLTNCHDLDPWSSRCPALSNSGFGPRAKILNDLVPDNLKPAWFWTDMYSAEVIYHTRMLHYKCSTSDQEHATAFYIPFYVGIALGKYLWFNHTAKDKDHHSVQMLRWVEAQKPWKRSNGSDHFIVLGRLTWDFRRLSDNDDEWGTKFIYMPSMKNVLRLTVERSRWDELEVSVPYPTSFHPASNSDIATWQRFIRTRERTGLFTFVGAKREHIKNDFRGVLMDYCKSESSCRVVDCSVTRCYDGSPDILRAFLGSDFCLQPKGDGFTRRSAFDCMLAGSIPVYFWRESFEYQYEWHLSREPGDYSVFIDRGLVRNDTEIIKRVLGGFSREKVAKMREEIVRLVPKLIYAMAGADLGGVSDAFDIAVEGVLKRFKRQRDGINE